MKQNGFLDNDLLNVITQLSSQYDTIHWLPNAAGKGL